MKNQDLSVLKAILLREMEERKMCEQCGAPMYEKMCTECGYMEEELEGGQKKLDVAEPFGKLTAADFKALRAKKDMEEGVKEDSDERVARMQGQFKEMYNLGYTTGYSDAQSGRKANPMKENHKGADHEVSMANNSIDSIIWAAHELKKHLQGGERDIPAWIQDHITNAENYILQAAKNYHEYGSKEGDQEDDFSGTYDDGLDEMSLSSLMEAKKKPSAGLTKKQKSTIAKKAKAGKDIGKKGKGFEKIASKAAEKYGSEERGRKVAAAAMWKSAAKKASK